MDFTTFSASRFRVFLLCLAVTVALAAPAVFPSLWGGVLGALVPIPVAAAFLLGGASTGLAVALSAAAAVIALAGPAAGLFLLADAGLMGACVSLGLRLRLPYARLTVLAAGMVLLGHLSISLVPPSVPHLSLAASLQVEMDRALAQLQSVMAEGGPQGAIPLPLAGREHLLTALFSGLFATGALVNTLICALVASRLVPVRTGEAPWPSFLEWRLPDHLVWVFIVSGFIVFHDHRLAWGLPVGILVVMSLLYAMQGVAVALHLARSRGIRPWVRLLALALILLQPFLLAAFVLIGLTDFRFDFRKSGSGAGGNKEGDREG